MKKLVILVLLPLIAASELCTPQGEEGRYDPFGGRAVLRGLRKWPPRPRPRRSTWPLRREP